MEPAFSRYTSLQGTPYSGLTTSRWTPLLLPLLVLQCWDWGTQAPFLPYLDACQTGAGAQGFMHSKVPDS